MTLSRRDACPECRSQQFKKNGHIHNGKQNHHCKACDRQFVVDATHRVIVEEHRMLVECLLCEKISLHGICRAMGVSIRWLMDFMVARFAAAPEHLHLQPVAASRDILIGCLAGEADSCGVSYSRRPTPSGSGSPWISRRAKSSRSFTKSSRICARRPGLLKNITSMRTVTWPKSRR